LEFAQSFTVPFPPDRVWHCFHDIEAVVRCLPGAALTEPPRDGQLALSMTVRLGPIVANFAGRGEMTLDETAHRGRIAGAGSDRKSGSRIRGEAVFSLHGDGDAAASTKVDIRVEYSIAGTLAQFSRGGLVRELAERMTAQFSDNLRSRLEAEPVQLSVASADSGESAPPSAAPMPPPVPLDIGRTFRALLIARIKRWLGLPPKRSDDAQPRGD
jgi:carbon monoxide dehydrogenase subunit G